MNVLTLRLASAQEVSLNVGERTVGAGVGHAADRRSEAGGLVKHQIFVVEDHVELREALTRFLNEQPDLEVCGVAASGAEALAALREARAEVVIVDLSMPDLGGMQLIKRLLKNEPDVRPLIFSAHADAAYAEEALEAGARGYVSKMNPQELLVAIQQVLRGDIYLSDGMRNQLANRAAG